LAVAWSSVDWQNLHTLLIVLPPIFSALSMCLNPLSKRNGLKYWQRLQ
jgi:hypothetical protein